MVGEWKTASLGKVCKEIYRYPSFYGMEKHAHGVPVIRGEHLLPSGAISTDWSDYWFVSEEYAHQYPKTRVALHDLVMSVRGSIGKFARVGPAHVGAQISPNVIRLSPDPAQIEPTYFYYALKGSTASAFISSTSSSSAVPALRASDIKLAEIPVPPVPEQRAIAHILGTLDDKIELNRRMNETLEAMARALFKSWFVDFDPVRAKTAGRDPGLPRPVADLFPARLVDSEFGQIPEGWEVVPLPREIEVNPTRPLRKGDVAQYLDMASMPTRGHAPDATVDRPFGSGMRFKNGDTLVARITPCLENGKTAFVDFLQEGQVGWGSTEFIVLSPKPPLPDEYAYCLARSVEFREFAIQSMTGSSGRQRVPAESLSHYQLVRPTGQVARRYGECVRPLFARASAATQESRSLAALRDTLLPKLISGELRVKDAEHAVGRTLA